MVDISISGIVLNRLSDDYASLADETFFPFSPIDDAPKAKKSGPPIPKTSIIWSQYVRPKLPDCNVCPNHVPGDINIQRRTIPANSTLAEAHSKRDQYTERRLHRKAVSNGKTRKI